MCRSRAEWPTGIAVLVVFVCAGVCLGGCAGDQTAPDRAEPAGLSNVERLLVAPFYIATERYEVGTTLECSVCGAVFVTGPIARGDDTYMTEQLLAYLKSKTTFSLIPPEEGEGVRSKIVFDSVDQSRRDILLEMGKKLDADAVISGTLFRFRRRVGTGYSVETPASVAFSIYLIRVSDGQLLWDGHFDETQKPLSEDLFRLFSFIKGGGAWLTAEELARQGLDKVMATFPVR
jgi:hypothetical protein